MATEGSYFMLHCMCNEQCHFEDIIIDRDQNFRYRLHPDGDVCDVSRYGVAVHL